MGTHYRARKGQLTDMDGVTPTCWQHAVINTCYSLQSSLFIPDAVGFCSPPRPEFAGNQMVEGLHLSFFLFALVGLKGYTFLYGGNHKQIASENWLLAVLGGVIYATALVVSSSFLHCPFFGKVLSAN